MPPAADPPLANRPAADEPATLSRALLDAEFERIASSDAFRHGPRQLRFLRHLVDAVIAGRSASLREMSLGVEVFYRSEVRFDPKQDSIVRVEARRLRQKLARYYSEEGQQARLEFVLPVGSYRVEIHHRDPVPPGERQRASLGVFELTPLGDAADLAALAAALSAELVGALSRLNGLRVVALAGPAPGNRPTEMRRAARRVNVDSLLQGAISRQGGGWRIELQLTRVDDHRVMWSRHALAADGGTMSALEPLARGIVAELHRDAGQRQLQRITLAGSRPLLPGLATGAPSSATLDQLSLARLAMRQNSPEGYRKAAALCEQAVLDAPAYPPAHALLAEALLGSVGLTALPSLPTMQAARRAALRAHELDPTLADALGLLGQIHLTLDHDWVRAEAAAVQAMRLAPAAARVHARYGWMLMMNGRLAEARASYAEARDLDPLSALYRVHGALISIYERQWRRAADELDEVLDVVPDHLVAMALRAALHLYAGETEPARVAYRQLVARFPTLSIGRCGLAQAHALAGEQVAAHALLAGLEAEFVEGRVSPYQIAMVHARLGAPDAALHWLGRSAQLCDYNFVCVAVDPAFDALRHLPGYRRLLAAHGMAHLLPAGAVRA